MSQTTFLTDLVVAKADGETVRKAMDFSLELRKLDAQVEFSQAMNRVQSRTPRVIKTGANPNFNSLYASLEDIQHALTPVYLEEGFSVSFNQGECPDKAKTRVLMTLYHVGGHSAIYQGDYPIDMTGEKSPIQAIVSSHSYAERDILRLAFHVVFDKMDKDGNRPAPNVARFISPDDVAEINTIIEDKNFNLDKMLKHIKVESLSRIPTTRLAEVLKMLHETPARPRAEGEKSSDPAPTNAPPVSNQEKTADVATNPTNGSGTPSTDVEPVQNGANAIGTASPMHELIDWMDWLKQDQSIAKLNEKLPIIASLSGHVKTLVKRAVSTYASSKGWWMDLKEKIYRVREEA